MTELSTNPVHSKFGLNTSETTQGSISTKWTWNREITCYEPYQQIKKLNYKFNVIKLDRKTLSKKSLQNFDARRTFEIAQHNLRYIIMCFSVGY